jgi:GNAT superfamily N-acetyltransferase
VRAGPFTPQAGDERTTLGYQPAPGRSSLVPLGPPTANTRSSVRPLTGDTVTSLEMTSPRQLVPGRSPPAALELQEVGRAQAALVRSTYVRIGAPHSWTGRSSWSDAQWEEELSRPGVRAWIAPVDEDVVGLVELEADETGDVGIVVFGLVPEFVGTGLGGAFLTAATQLAWKLTSPLGIPANRVWVQTSSRDHPHALRNYESRGFRAFRTEEVA